LARCGRRSIASFGAIWGGKGVLIKFYKKEEDLVRAPANILGRVAPCRQRRWRVLGLKQVQSRKRRIRGRELGDRPQLNSGGEAVLLRVKDVSRGQAWWEKWLAAE